MVTREEMARIARRYDTAMSHAMLDALGLPRRMPTSNPTVVSVAEDPRYAGLTWCMRNTASPMDAWPE